MCHGIQTYLANITYIQIIIRPLSEFSKLALSGAMPILIPSLLTVCITPYPVISLARYASKDVLSLYSDFSWVFWSYKYKTHPLTLISIYIRSRAASVTAFSCFSKTHPPTFHPAFNSTGRKQSHQHTKKYIYIYIYIYTSNKRYTRLYTCARNESQRTVA